MEKEKIEHLSIIMDGNRRWAKANNKLVIEGHRVGAEKILETLDWCIEKEIKYLTVFAFSTENWKRDKKEVDDIMSLLREYLSKKNDKFNKKNIKIKVIGSEENIDKDILIKIKEIEEKTKNNTQIQFNIAFNYGGRKEIVDICKNIAKLYKNDLIKTNDIDENFFKNNLYFGNIPEPDIVLRTGKTYRISNFLLWEIAYSELFFIDEYWPDFNKKIFDEIINNFYKRRRTYGGTK